MIAWSIGALLIFSIFSSAIGLKSPLLVLNENQVLYLFSTSAQVIAAIYGLTLTGFLFFRNELTREVTEDETLAEAIDQLKSRYFVLLVFISILVFLMLALANIIISYEASPYTNQTTILINIGQSTFVVSFLAIVLFIFDVVAPQRIESASRNIQDQLDPKQANEKPGDISEFLRNYNEIEILLNEAGKSYLSTTAEFKRSHRVSNIRLAEMLFRNEQIDSALYQQLRELITLRNVIIHGAEPVVSKALVKNSAEVLCKLKAVVGN